jgi:2-polyprenyl-3-methyl-5-hydroxy-6-metoxy-1,4-benzoquinol methylase
MSEILRGRSSHNLSVPLSISVPITPGTIITGLRTGVEYSDFAAEKGRQNGLDIKTGALEGSGYPDSYFDVITMLDVLEHVTSPKDVLKEANRILKNGGMLVVNTPDCER